MSSSSTDRDRYRDDPFQFAQQSNNSQHETSAETASHQDIHDDDDSKLATNLDASLQLNDDSPSFDGKRWKSRLNGTKNRLQKIGTTLQKVNVAKWIDNLEHDQEIADELEEVNREYMEECERREMMREAASACMDAILQHLHEFVQEHPRATYEEWITDLHPENSEEGKLLEGMDKTLDHRFYVEESDHRKLWNDNLTLFLDEGEEPRRHVPAKAKIGDVYTKSIHELFDTDKSESEEERMKQTHEVIDLDANPASNHMASKKDSSVTQESSDCDNKVPEGDLLVFE